MRCRAVVVLLAAAHSLRPIGSSEQPRCFATSPEARSDAWFAQADKVCRGEITGQGPMPDHRTFTDAQRHGCESMCRGQSAWLPTLDPTNTDVDMLKTECHEAGMNEQGDMNPFGNKVGYSFCCSIECCDEQTPSVRLPCPPPDASFPQPHGTTCQVVNIGGAIATLADDAQVQEIHPWKAGLEMYADHVNSLGGLRMRSGQVGYLNVTLQILSAEADKFDFTFSYFRICSDPTVDIMLAPIDAGTAVAVLAQLQSKWDDRSSGCSRKPILSPAVASDMFDKGYKNVFSVYSLPRLWARESIDFLHSRGARSFAIAGQQSAADRTLEASLADRFRGYDDTTLGMHALAQRNELSITQNVDGALRSRPDVLVGLGDVSTLRLLVKAVAEHEFTPKAAFFINELSMPLSYRSGSEVSARWQYDQWMGTIAWTVDMHYDGQRDWSGYLDRYLDRNTTQGGVDKRWSRYLGSAQSFGTYAGAQLGTEPDFYHAHAAATLMMLHQAVELAPETDGWGLQFSDLSNVVTMRKAFLSLNVSSFFGLVHLNETGWNDGFVMGIGQFQGTSRETMPRLVGPDSCLGPDVVGNVTYPAAWDCHVTNTCPVVAPPGIFKDMTQGQMAVTLGCVVVLLAVVAACVCMCCRSGKNRDVQPNVLRESIIGGAESMPAAMLAQKDVNARWVAATTQLQNSTAQSPVLTVNTVGRTNSAQFMSSPMTPGSGGRRQLRNQSAQLLTVMFTKDHIRELEPGNNGWRDQILGTGSFGNVYRAVWRGVDVAVKVLQLPAEPEGTSEAARRALVERVTVIRDDFVNEVEICCDLAHPNLVRLMGFATEPELLVVQELLLGKALDTQLYVERWRPTESQRLKVALDVGSGMQYLHTAFEDPIIHRDLKSPNLLLAAPPPDPGEDEVDGLLVKISDFGLSKDKKMDEHYKKTVMMTGCGSVLWMAPEILLGEKYNEKVDVFSYAMCLVELEDGNLPWHGYGGAAEVPHRVGQCQRPERQLSKAESGMAGLIADCWQQSPHARPTFTEIVERLEKLSVALAERRDLAEADEEDGQLVAVSRPASPPRGSGGGRIGSQRASQQQQRGSRTPLMASLRESS